MHQLLNYFLYEVKKMETKILLENGTNELEVLEFKIDEHCYGINVAKIKEIITYQNVTPVPKATSPRI